MEIEISSGVTSIGQEAFCGCDSITEITLPESFTSIPAYLVYGCTSLTQISIPDGVTSIGEKAFYNCSSLAEISIPSGVTSIGSNAFDGCSSLTEIDLPEGITQISGGVFENCTSLSTIVIPENVTTIGRYAFYKCASLTEINIPIAVTSIGAYAFNGCTALSNLYYDGLCSEWNALDIDATVQRFLENVTFHFAESALEMSECLIYLSTKTYTYDGNAKEPELTVICNGITITQGADYTVSYTDNINVGTATVTVAGIGNYSGTAIRTFTINQAPPSLEISADATSLILGDTSQITVSANGSGAISYSSSDESVATVSSDGKVTAVGYGSATITVSVEETDNYTSASGAMKFTVKLKTPTITSIEQTTDGVALTWDSVNGAELYAVYRRTSSSGTLTKIATTTDTSYVDYLDRTAGSTDYTYSVCCVKSNGTTLTSAYSEYVSITVTIENQTITASADSLSLIKGGTAMITASTSGDGKISYSSSDTDVATVSSSGKVTAVGYGTAVITITAAATVTNIQATKTLTFTVKLAAPAISSISNEASGIKLTWGAVSGAEAYAVYRKTSSGSWSLVATTMETSYIDTAIRSNDGTTYYYRICCVTSDGGTITSAYNSSKSLARKTTTCTVTFDGRGVATIASQTVAYGDKATEPSNSMARSEYTFVGWYNGDEEWDFDDEVTGDITLTAQWEDEEDVFITTSGIVYARWNNAHSSAKLIQTGDTVILDAYHCYTVCDSVSWTGYTTGFTKVQQINPSAEFKAKKAGTYAITATATSYQTGIVGGVVSKMYNTDTSTFDFKVVDPVTSVSVSKSSISMEVGESTPFEYSTTPSGNWARTASGFYMKSSDKSVVTISDDAILTAVGVGTATITIGTEDGYTATCKVTVSKASVTPSAPTLSSVANASTGIKVNWKKVSGADGYYIYRSTSKSGTYSKVGTVTSASTVTYTDTGSVKSISSGTTYYYKVYAYSGSKKSSASSIKSIRYLKAGKISSLTNAVKGITLKWSKVSGASGYYIYRKVSGGDYSKVKTISSASTVSWTDTAVKSKSGKTYTYYVVPYYKDSSGNVTKGSYSTKSLRRLSAATVSSLTNTSSGITVKWSKITGASGYYVYRKTGSGDYTKIATVSGGSKVSYTNKTSGTYKVSNGTTYTYYVIPYYKSSSGTVTKGPYSAAKKTVRLTAVSVSSVTNSATKSLTVKYKKNSKASGYQIQYSTSKTFASGNKTVTVSGASTLSKKITKLTKGKTYYVRVRAYKTVIETKYYSAWSSKKSVKISK